MPLKPKRAGLGVNHRSSNAKISHDQVVYRDGKREILKPMLCRAHNEPWLDCVKCSRVRSR